MDWETAASQGRGAGWGQYRRHYRAAGQPRRL